MVHCGDTTTHQSSTNTAKGGYLVNEIENRNKVGDDSYRVGTVRNGVLRQNLSD